MPDSISFRNFPRRAFLLTTNVRNNIVNTAVILSLTRQSLQVIDFPDFATLNLLLFCSTEKFKRLNYISRVIMDLKLFLSPTCVLMDFDRKYLRFMIRPSLIGLITCNGKTKTVRICIELHGMSKPHTNLNNQQGIFRKKFRTKYILGAKNDK